MFTDTTHAVAFGKQFVFQNRAMEIATRGVSKTQIPKKIREKPQSKNLGPVLRKIHFALEEQEEIMNGMTGRIFRTSRLAAKLVKSNPKMAASTMRKVKSIQQKFVRVLRVKAGMEAYEEHVKLGLQNSKDVELNLRNLRRCPWNNRATRASDEMLLGQLEAREFFPLMDAQGRITLSAEPPFMLDCDTKSMTDSTAFSSGTPVHVSPCVA